MYEELLTCMQSDLGLQRGEHERETDYTLRLLWSALGRMLQAALFDRYSTCASEAEAAGISIVRFKRRIQHLVEAYAGLFPNLMFPQALLAVKDDKVREEASLVEIAKYLCQLVLANGMAYHRAYNLLPPMLRRQRCGSVTFVRGLPPGEPVKISGLGMYQKSVLTQEPATEAEIEAVRDMFQLDNPLNLTLLDYLIQSGKFVPATDSKHLQYFHAKERRWREYAKPGIMLAREKISYAQKMVYCLCRRAKNGQEEWLELPKSQDREIYDHGLLAQLFLLQADSLPPAQIRYDGAIVHITCEYLYPGKEQRFLSLFSWPEPGQIGYRAKTHRIMTTDLFKVWRILFEALGYSFTEEET